MGDKFGSDGVRAGSSEKIGQHVLVRHVFLNGKRLQYLYVFVNLCKDILNDVKCCTVTRSGREFLLQFHGFSLVWLQSVDTNRESDGENVNLSMGFRFGNFFACTSVWFALFLMSVT